MATLVEMIVGAGVALLLWWQKPSLGMWISGAIWVGFLVYWGNQAKTPTPVVKAETQSSALRHAVLRQIGLLLLFVPIWGLDQAVLPAGPIHAWAGIGVQLLGAWLYLRSKRELGRQWSSAVSIKTDHQLIRTGPYRFVRHPMYTAMITMALGTAIVNTRVHALIGAAHDEWRRQSWKLFPPLY